jgi:hypothetical protein
MVEIETAIVVLIFCLPFIGNDLAQISPRRPGQKRDFRATSATIDPTVGTCTILYYHN